MPRFTLDVTWSGQTGMVRDNKTGKTTREYALTEAEEILYWLHDRDLGYQLTHEKMKCILVA